MLKYLSVFLLTIGLGFSGYSQNKSGWASAHKAAHQEQLAAHKSKLDKRVIGTMIEEEVKAREGVEDGLSEEASYLIDDLLKEAATHIGKRYSLGSKGPKAFDCSGFTGYVYRQFGYSVGACSRDQYKYGKSIDKKDLRRGDLVFFTSRSSGKNVGHVGIVWEVDKENNSFKFIHASTRGGIKISDFEGYYVKRYVGARRVIE